MHANRIALVVLLGTAAAVANAAPASTDRPRREHRTIPFERHVQSQLSKTLCESNGITAKSLASASDRVSEVALNPQPLPPSPADRVNEVALNPQPLPPSPADRVNEVALNPQPLPPAPDRIAGAVAGSSIVIPPDPIRPADRASEVALNPQPLPPEPPPDRLTSQTANISNVIPPDPIRPVNPNPPDPVRYAGIDALPPSAAAVPGECAQPVTKVRQ
jgi:hypothetical protein